MTVNFKSFAGSTIAKRIVLTISTDKFKYSIRLFWQEYFGNQKSSWKKKSRLILYDLKYTKKAFTAEFQSRFLINSTETARTPGPFLPGSQARSSSNLRGSRAGLQFPPLPCRLLTFPGRAVRRQRLRSFRHPPCLQLPGLLYRTLRVQQGMVGFPATLPNFLDALFLDPPT